MAELPRLMLHCCCAPCSSHVLEYLSPHYNITALFFNPNIKPVGEYEKRAGEMEKLLSLASYPNNVELLVVDYDGIVFDTLACPFMDEPEGGRRCRICFEIRLSETAKQAKNGGYDYFATTLSVSPHKDAALINDVGNRAAEKYGASNCGTGKCGTGYLPADFKKHSGFSRSVELSRQYGLYRQNYCGCRPIDSAPGNLSGEHNNA